jgi:dCMP deaminase
MNQQIHQPKEIISWDECFMRMAHTIARRSKDPSTQTGAVVVDQHNVILGLGYNGFPRGIDGFSWSKEGSLLNTKYPYVCHAEENAIYNSHGSIKGAKIYTTLFPCNECAKTIIQNGVRQVIFESHKHQGQDIYVAAERLFDAAGIPFRQYLSCWSDESH